MMRLTLSLRDANKDLLRSPRALRIALLLALLAIWQIAAAYLSGIAYYVSAPYAIGKQIAGWFASGYIWPHLLSTLDTTLSGFLLAAVLGVVLAVVIGSVRFADRVFSPLIFIAYATPKVVLAPVLILWVGVGKPPAIILAFLTAFFMVFFNVLNGIRQVSPAHLNLAALLGAGPVMTAWKFRVPAAAPSIATGLQQGLVYAFHGAMLGEMTASNRGIGYLVVLAATGMDANAVIAALCVIGALSYLLIVGLEGALRIATPAHGITLAGNEGFEP